LGQDDHVDLRAAIREAAPGDNSLLDEALDKALGAKPEKHDFRIDRRGAAPAVARHMSMTGG
ncbi:MAG: GTP 3',8-cyclase MoaA, partial [Pseudomonadota bacterium]